MGITEKKNKIRNKIKDKKKTLSIQYIKNASDLIFQKIEKLEEFQSANTVMLYWSLPVEVFTHDFILKWYNKKQIILPVVAGDVLEIGIFTGIGNMVNSKNFGLFNPTGITFNKPEEIDLIIVPGIAFDWNNNRLGHGKAYYDKFLPGTRAFKIGVCFDFQLLDEIPVTETDVKMDLVVTD